MRAGPPQGAAQWLALALALALALGALAAARLRRRDAAPAPPRRAVARAFVATAALAAALLSAAYVVVYLRGGPRIIDAATYWLEARALARGHLTWPVDEPAASTIGRFLLRSDPPEGAPQAAGIFPPGYPALLALGFLAGAPLAIGPLLAAALAVATWDLAARWLPPDVDHERSALPLVPALAALFSALCAALRYHTADTMSHGLAALCFTAALAFAARALDLGAGRWAALAGLAAGWLAATRPPSALALAATLIVVLLCHRAPRPAKVRAAALIAIGALPGLALLAAHQRAATGGWSSSQALYYAVSDGPPGCFRYGFGADVGCLGEHGDFVAERLPHGFGAVAAAGTTLRRLAAHLVDPLNAEPLALLVLAGAALAWRARRARPLVLAIPLQIAAYAPFYFDGNYPGGGGRFFADVLPVEHALAALAIAALARRLPAAATLLASAALLLAGFALRAGFDHALLRDREGGAPMFEPATLARAGVTRGLVFVETDHGFALGFDPDPSAVQVLRYRGDDLDRMAWEARGGPPAFRHRFVIPRGGGPAAISIEPLRFDPDPPAVLRIEGEGLWPALTQRDAWAWPEHADNTCASAGRWLRVRPLPRGAPEIRVALPAPWLRGRRVAPRVALAGPITGAVRLLADRAVVHTWPLPEARTPAPGARHACVRLPPQPVPEGATQVELALAADPAPPETGFRNSPWETPGDPENIFALDMIEVGNSIDH